MFAHGQGAWAQLMEKYGVDYALVQRRSFGSKMDTGVLFEAIEWPLVYVDGNSYIYMKPGSANQAKTAGLTIRLIRSRDSAEIPYKKATDQPAVMAADLRRIDPESLLSAGDFCRFGAAAFAAGEGKLSEVFFKEKLTRHPKDLTIRMNLAFLMVRQGRRSEAREQFARVITIGKGTPLAAKAEENLRSLPP